MEARLHIEEAAPTSLQMRFDVNVDAEIEHRHWRMRCIFEAGLGARIVMLRHPDDAQLSLRPLARKLLAPRRSRVIVLKLSSPSRLGSKYIPSMCLTGH